jgi:phosphatidylinositol kinase/protein kinase (PI-3  family)
MTQFAQTTALTSVLGFCLGVGDRHPRNIMVERQTGQAIHVDFADCFETGLEYLTFPDLVPFRMTRMIVAGLGPARFEGNFRMVCEEVLKLLREMVLSLRAVLDIFLVDPIIAEADDKVKEVIEKVQGGGTAVPSQVQRLIDLAIEPYNLAKFDHTWAPLW